MSEAEENLDNPFPVLKIRMICQVFLQFIQKAGKRKIDPVHIIHLHIIFRRCFPGFLSGIPEFFFYLCDRACAYIGLYEFVIKVDILIYYDNTEIDNIYKLLDLISDEFSGQDLKIDLDNEKTFIRNIRNEGLITQAAMINNYERLGIRFSFYANLYKINKGG